MKMKFKLTAQALFTTFALCGAVGAPAIAQMQPNPGHPAPNQGAYPGTATPRPPTSFVCGRVGTHPATLVRVKGRTLQSPLLVFKTASNKFTPQQRCESVSRRMTEVVARNGGKLSNLLLTTGKVSGQAVICVINTTETCNPSNVILTLLRQENAENPGKVLTSIVRYARDGGGGGTVEGGGIEGEEEIKAVSLEEMVNEVASESGGTDPSYNQNPGNSDPNSGGDGRI